MSVVIRRWSETSLQNARHVGSGANTSGWFGWCVCVSPVCLPGCLLACLPRRSLQSTRCLIGAAGTLRVDRSKALGVHDSVAALALTPLTTRSLHVNCASADAPPIRAGQNNLFSPRRNIPNGYASARTAPNAYQAAMHGALLLPMHVAPHWRNNATGRCSEGSARNRNNWRCGHILCAIGP